MNQPADSPTNPVGGQYPDVIYAIDFSCWKKSVLRRFFDGSKIMFVRSASQAPARSTLAVWGSKPIPGKLAEGVRLLRLEDGFLRSVGLGADLIRPVSWVIDTLGIYYDASKPSDLERLLETAKFSPELLERAKRLRERIVASGLTKYNLGGSAWRRPEGVHRVILVPGQVETDASLVYGAPGIRANMGLLRAAREANPGAYLIYKPHPDVLAGLRAKGEDEDNARVWCDELVTDVAMGDLLPAVDEVHVLTSLTGFEAMLRRKPVTCYGQPFYSSWGLTSDFLPVPRRKRKLSLDELVAGALILYPKYISRDTKRLVSPEDALEELLAWRPVAGGNAPWWRKLFRVALRRVVGVR